MKLWGLRNPGITSTPVAEFYDHENPVQCVSLSSDSKYAAAGANDGKVIVWDQKAGAEQFSYQVSQAGR